MSASPLHNTRTEDDNFSDLGDVSFCRPYRDPTDAQDVVGDPVDSEAWLGEETSDVGEPDWSILEEDDLDAVGQHVDLVESLVSSEGTHRDTSTVMQLPGIASPLATEPFCVESVAKSLNLTPEHLEILQGGKATEHRYGELPPVRIATLTECDDPRSALWQWRVLSQANKKGVATLYSKHTQDLLGHRPSYREVIEANKHVIKPILSKRTGKLAHRPARLTHSGHGRSGRYRIEKPLRNKPAASRPHYGVEGTYAARWYRQQIAAAKAIQERLDRLDRILIDRTITLDLSHVREECTEGEWVDVRQAIGRLGNRRYTKEQTGRLHTALTTIPRTLRPFLRMGGKRLTSIDVRWAHVAFLALHAIRSWDLPQEEVEGLYNLLREDPRRLLGGKKKALQWLNDTAGEFTCTQSESFWAKHFPEFHLRFTEHRRELEHAMYKVYASTESEVMTSLLECLETKGLLEAVAGREHDGLRVTEERAEEILEAVREELGEATGGLLQVALKSPEKERAEALAEETLLVTSEGPNRDTSTVMQLPNPTDTIANDPTDPITSPQTNDLVPLPDQNSVISLFKQLPSPKQKRPGTVKPIPERLKSRLAKAQARTYTRTQLAKEYAS